jgi:hypothetical protein
MRFRHDFFKVRFSDHDGFQIHSVSCENRNPNLSWNKRLTTWNYKNKKSKGIWMPVDCKMELKDWYAPDADTPLKEAHLTSHWMGEPQVVGSSKAAPIPWYIDFPVGTRLNNALTNQQITIGGDGAVAKENVQNLSQSIEDSSSIPVQGAYKSKLTKYVLIAIALAIVLLAMFFIRLRWRSRGLTA